MKSAPASIASIDACRTWSYEPSSEVSRMTLRWASPQASRTRTISSITRVSSPDRKASREITMSISSAPVATASSASRSFTSREACPLGNAVVTAAALTPVPSSDAPRRSAPGTRRQRRTTGSLASWVPGRPPWRTGCGPCRRVGALERGQVRHRDRQPDALLLRARLDRALAEHRRPLLDPDPVHVGKPADHGTSMPDELLQPGRYAAVPRAAVIVLDACGVGALPGRIGLRGRRRLQHPRPPRRARRRPRPTEPRRLGLGSIIPIEGVPPAERPVLHGRLHPFGPGKESTTGHWELMGVVPSTPCPRIRTASRPR